MGFFYWGEENNPRCREPSGHYETVNPRRLNTLHRVDRNEDDLAAVRTYERNPDAALDGGRPWIRRSWWSGDTLMNGHHRRQAAINRGRRLRVWVPD